MKIKFYILSFLLASQFSISLAGFISGTLVHDGKTRKYVIYVPSIYTTQNIKVPLLVGLHGNGDNAANFSQICMSNISDTANYIVVYPEALPDPLLTTNAWHSGAGALGVEVNSTVDDVGFINKLMNTIIAGYQIDTNRMYVFGFSFGGFMTNKMAAADAKRFAAAACVSGLRGNYNTSIPAVPVPYLHFHGTADAVITYDGTGGSFPYLGMTPENTTKFWATQNGCSLTPVIDTMPDLTADGLKFIRYTYNHSSNNNKAILYKVVNGEHDWYFRPTNDIDYCQTIWSFFRQYAKTSAVIPNTPTASFTTSDTTVCIGSTLTFTSTSTATSGSLDSIRWTILGGTPSTGTTTAITSTFNTVGTYVITLKAYKNGNVSTATKSIRVKALPTVNAITGTTSVCIGAATTLSNTTPNGTWSTSNGAVATVSNGVVSGVSVGTANIYYSVTANGCTKAVATTVTVNALPTISGTLSVCVGATTTLSGSATPNTTTPWLSATPSVATINANGVVTGVAQGTSIITYKNANGCTKTATVTVNALPTVNAITGTTSVCIGATTTLSNTTPNGTWSTSNGAVATVSNGIVSGVFVGTANIYYSVTASGCTKAVATTVTVNALPTISGTLSVCVGATTTLSGSATPNATTPWLSATPSVATINANGVVTGVAQGTSIITYKNANGCTKTATITVNALPITPTITKRNDSLICSITTGTSYKWYLNGTIFTTTTLPKIKLTQNGSYTVEVVGANTCTSALSAGFNATITGIKNNRLDIQYSILPNPNNGLFEMKITSAINKTYQLKIFSISGQEILSEEINIKAGQNSTPINLTGIDKGIYLLSLISDDGISTQNIIVQ